MRPQRNSKLNGFERKNKEIVCFSLKTIEFTVALRLHLYFASAALLAGPGWARAGGRAGLGQGWRPTGGAALAAVSELGLFVGWAGRGAGRWPVGRLPGLGRGWRPVGGVGMQAVLATVSELVGAGLGRLVRRLGWASGWSVAGGPAACHAAVLLWAGSRAGLALAGLLWASCAGGCWPVQAALCQYRRESLAAVMACTSAATRSQRCLDDPPI